MIGMASGSTLRTRPSSREWHRDSALTARTATRARTLRFNNIDTVRQDEKESSEVLSAIVACYNEVCRDLLELGTSVAHPMPVKEDLTGRLRIERVLESPGMDFSSSRTCPRPRNASRINREQFGHRQTPRTDVAGSSRLTAQRADRPARSCGLSMTVRRTTTATMTLPERS